MAKKIINVGKHPLKWDRVNSAVTDINDNFDELYGNLDLGAVSESIIPDADVTYDLGSSTYRFRDLYLSGSTINLGGATISATPSGDISLGSGSLIASNVLGTGITSISYNGVDYSLNDTITFTDENGGVVGIFPFEAIVDLSLNSDPVTGPNTIPANFTFTYGQNRELTSMTLTDPGSGYLTNASVYPLFISYYPPATPILIELLYTTDDDPDSIFYKSGGVDYIGLYFDLRPTKPIYGPLPWILADGITVQPDDTPITAVWTDGTRTVNLTYQRTFTSSVLDIENNTTYYYVFEVDPLTMLSVTGQFTSDDFESELDPVVAFHIDYDYPTVLIPGRRPEILPGQYENYHYLEIIIGAGENPGQDTSESLRINIGPITSQTTGSVVISSDESTPTFGSVTLAETLTLIPGEEPLNPVEGTIAIANGTSWDPAGDGTKQLVLFLNSTWNLVTLTPVTP
jgi:hypothetical protein